MTQTTQTLTTQDVKISLKRKQSADEAIMMQAKNAGDTETNSTTTSSTSKTDLHVRSDHTLPSKKMRTNGGSRIVRNIINEDQHFWDQIGVLNKDSRTPGIIPRLEPDFRKADTLSAYLCSPLTDHLSTSFMDLGWGCGYRNCQMLMSYLERKKVDGEPLIKNVLDIHGIQLLIERAWSEGFDSLGAAQLGHHVFKTRKWIGTTEVYTLLTYLGIRSTIIDFHHPGPKRLHKDLLDWIQSYFMEAVKEKENSSQERNSNNNYRGNNVYITNRPPIYLQHQGHSRTVIGIEILKSGKRNLIMFDPGRRVLRSYRKQPPPSYAEDSHDEEEEEEEDVDENDSEDEDYNDQRLQPHNTESSSNASSPLSSISSGRDDNGLDDEDEDEEIDILTDIDPHTSTPPTPTTVSSSPASSEDTTSTTGSTRRFLAKIKIPTKALKASSSSSSTNLPSSSLLRPFRVDDKTIGKHKQYSVLVIGHVQQTENGKMSIDSTKSLLLNEEEREHMKNVTSLTVI